MEYVYDIILNFQDQYYEFYEWKCNDKILNVKKIPIYRIKTQDYLKIKQHQVRINLDSFSKKNKMYLLTSGKEIMGIYLDNDGRVLKKSSLIFEEADDILEDKDKIIKLDISYNVERYFKETNVSRLFREKTNYIKNYLNNLDKEKDEYLFKYLYYDIYNLEEDNVDNIMCELIKLSKNDFSKLYDCIKRVNLELKK